jgi:SAM-dependent methyltransferase
VREGLVSVLACPQCRSALEVSERLAAGEDTLVEGTLRGRSCAHAFPVVGGVPRLFAPDVAPPRVPEFDRQWRHYGRLRRLFGKDEREMRRNLGNARMGSRITTAWYAGRTVLDAGCGHGRYVRAFRALGATAVGLDASPEAARAAGREDDPRAQHVQGDVRRLPFRDGSFDLAFCDGVLHHTDDPAGGFAELVRVTRPGGAVYAWLYPPESRLREAVMGTARALTTRLPGAALRFLSFALAPATLFVRSYSGTRFLRATWAECAQVVHDWLAPRRQSHHSYEEVAGWARAAGLEDLERLPIPTGILAWKPMA